MRSRGAQVSALVAAVACAGPPEGVDDSLPPGPPEVVAPAFAIGLAARAGFLFYPDYLQGSVFRVPAGGGDAVPVGKGLIEPKYLLVDDDAAYVTSWATSTLHRIDLATGDTTVLADGLEGPYGAPAMDGKHVWVRGDRTIAGVPNRGGEVVRVALGQLPLGLAADRDAVYYAGEHTLVSVTESGGHQATLAASLERPGPIAVDATQLYFADRGTIFAIPREGGTISALGASPGGEGPLAIAVDETHVYWITWSGTGYGGLFRARKTGGPTTEILRDRPDPRGGIAVDDGYVYWTEQGGVMKLAK